MHINSNDLNNFQNEEMNTDEIIAFLEHMKHCDYCLNQIQKTAANATYKMRFFYEGLRTVVGVVLALVMLFSLGQMDFVSPQLPQSTAKSSETRREIRTSLRNFSNGITDGISDAPQKVVNYINSISNTITNGGN